MSTSKQKHILDLMLILNPKLTVGEAAKILNKIKRLSK